MFDRTAYKSCLLISLIAGPASGFILPSSTTHAIGFQDHQRQTVRLRYKTDDKVADLGDSMNFLSISEMKLLLSQRGVDFGDCIDQRDLIEKLRESQSDNSDGKENTLFSSPTNDQFGQEDSLISAFKNAAPSVAHIKTKSTPRRHSRDLNMHAGMEPPPPGSGSGFLWDGNGHVVTNFHVASGGRNDGSMPDDIKVKLAGMATSISADVVGFDTELDLAVLKLRQFDPRTLPPPILIGVSSGLQVGQSVMAIGNPFGLDDTLTTGVVWPPPPPPPPPPQMRRGPSPPMMTDDEYFDRFGHWHQQ